MREDQEQILNDYKRIKDSLESLSSSLSDNIKDTLKNCKNVDHINFRVKTEKSFSEKANSLDANHRIKYPNPFREMQDIIGGRVVVYYKSDLQQIIDELEKNYSRVEKKEIIPDDEKEFGYEGIHYIFLIPNHIYNPYIESHNVPYFFEFQIKTLYQHAWAQSEHGLGYKPDVELPKNIKRKLAFLAAQSWGADEILSELVTNINYLKN
ncbi:MAG: hypothetical protein ABFD00_02760 [Chloroherpetonaceae bacterium]